MASLFDRNNNYSKRNRSIGENKSKRQSKSTGRKCSHRRMNCYVGIVVFTLLIFSIFTLTLNSSIAIYHMAQAQLVIGQQTKNPGNIPAELAASTINAGKPPSTSNFNVTKGYKIEPVLWNLTLPSSVAFDTAGNMFVSEAGQGFGGLSPTERILKITQNGTISLLTDKFLTGPITSMVFHQGKLYVANKGKISTVNPVNGAVQDIINDLPAGGDHPTNAIAFGPDGRLYFQQGSATNSGVVGEDSYSSNLGWLASYPFVHDVPAKNITLTGQNFQTPNLLADGPKKMTVLKDMIVKVSNTQNNTGGKISSGHGTGIVAGNVTGNVTTGAFVAYGNSTQKGEKINGNVLCSACIISSKPDGTDLKVVAWGMRLDAFTGLAFDKSGKLIVTDSGSEERGSRPIKGDDDKIWSIDVSNSSNWGKWYGWPDFFGGKNKQLLPVTDPQFKSPRGNQPLHFLMQDHPPLQKLFADPGYAVKMTAVATYNGNNKNNTFGLNGSALAGEYGTHAPFTQEFQQKVHEYLPGNTNTTIIGQKIIKLDTKTGNFTDFISLKKPDPYFRPVGLSFSNDGNALYIASFGRSEFRTALPSGEKLTTPTIWMYPNTGIIWKVTRVSGVAATEPPPAKLHLSPELTVAYNSGPPPSTSVLNLPPGYKVQPVLWNLNIPGSVAFDDKGNMYVGEVGYAYVGLNTQPRILKVDHQTGNVSVFVDRGLDRLLTSMVYHNGSLYVSNGGRVSIVDTKGMIKNLIVSLPGIGDHYVDGFAFGPDGRMYFGVGTATNSGVVGHDNPWAKATPQFHDIPGKTITLTGTNFKSHNFLKAPGNATVFTGGYSPYGTPTKPGQVIKGDIKCTGCILSAKPDGTDLKLVGWGFRHPYGLAFAPDGKLVVSMNSVDERGSRNVANSADPIYVIDVSNPKNLGKFYGWPDYYGDGLPVTDPQFNSPLNNQTLTPLIKNAPPPVKPTILTDVGAALTQVAISNSSGFGPQYKGQAFIGEVGTFAPQTHLSAASSYGPYIGTVMGKLLGQKVISFDPTTGNFKDFLTLNTAAGNFRPTGLQFSPDGKSLYVVGVGLLEVRTITPNGAVLPFPLGLPYSFEYSGVVWKITHTG
jgi:glucose/arabinose dehydrogenase